MRRDVPAVRILPMSEKRRGFRGRSIEDVQLQCFLRDLPRSVETGDYFFCHAGIRPGVPLNRQDPEDLIWIRDSFLNFAGLHPKVVVHGHTPSPEPEVMANRVNVDTGAFRTGVLTALVIEGADKRIMQVAG